MAELCLQDLVVEKWVTPPGPKTNSPLENDHQSQQSKIVAVHAFQMLCPGCIINGIPQAKKLHSYFDHDQVAILGLHSVFEHHDGMREVSLKACLHEFQVPFPVAIDKADPHSPIPQSMSKFELRGTPSWLIFNKQGQLAAHFFGHVEDIVISGIITQLLFQDDISTKKVFQTTRR